MKFVLMHLPGKVTYKEIDEMIETVDRNGDGKISFSEFRLVKLFTFI
jgi:Ca2+-binding EF-hand superfamily protein